METGKELKYKSIGEAEKAYDEGEISFSELYWYYEYFKLGPFNFDSDCDASEVDIY